MNPQTTKKFVLVADDNKLMATVLSNKLQAAGYEVAVVNDGDAVLKAVAARRPDLLLTDLIMPGKDGFIMLQELRANPATHDIKVVVTSDLQQAEDIAKVRQLGVLGVFDKANLQAIVEKIPDIIGH